MQCSFPHSFVWSSPVIFFDSPDERHWTASRKSCTRTSRLWNGTCSCVPTVLSGVAFSITFLLNAMTLLRAWKHWKDHLTGGMATLSAMGCKSATRDFAGAVYKVVKEVWKSASEIVFSGFRLYWMRIAPRCCHLVFSSWLQVHFSLCNVTPFVA